MPAGMAGVTMHETFRSGAAGENGDGAFRCFMSGKTTKENFGILKEYEDFMRRSSGLHERLVDCGLNPEDARFVLPNAANTTIAMTANFREWRHVFELRCDARAQWEIRRLCTELLRVLAEKEPAVFGDLRDRFIRAENCDMTRNCWPTSNNRDRNERTEVGKHRSANHYC